MTDKPSLNAAYSLETPEDSIALYGDWAETYDTGFVHENGYVLHAQVANAFVATGGAGPVLDIGAGTGLCGAVLAQAEITPIDGIDISPDMLAQAEQKGVYRNLFAQNLLAGLSVDTGTYAGVVSSGTFTHGHVGPEALPEVIRIMSPNGLAVLSINAAHFETSGFASAFEELGGALSSVMFKDVRIYDTTTQDSHSSDLARLAIFRKA